jgi:hypothetical protein
MWIVRLALNRPYAFVVFAIRILLLSPAVIVRTPTDIFPNIDIQGELAGRSAFRLHIAVSSSGHAAA